MYFVCRAVNMSRHTFILSISYVFSTEKALKSTCIHGSRLKNYAKAPVVSEYK